MARIVRAALAVGATLAALVGGATTANAAGTAYVQITPAGKDNLCVGTLNTAANGSAVFLDFCNNSWAYPVWEMVPTANSSYELRWAASNGKCLGVENSGTQAGAKAQLGDCSGGKQTRWQMDLVDPVRKTYQLRPTHTTGRCLDVPNSDVVEGTALQQWTCNQTGAQQWNLRQVTWPRA